MNYSTKLAYVSLEELLNAPLLNGKHEKGMCFGPGTRIVRMVDLYRGDTVNVNSLDRVEYPHLPANDYFLDEGDLLVNRTSLKREGVGKAVLVSNLPEPVYFDCSIIRIRPNKSKVYPRYLLYALNGPAVRPQIMKGAKTATITTISQPDISSLRIPLPPLPEQRRIAAILDKVGSIRRKRQETIRLTEEFLHSVFSDMFGNIGNFEHVKIQDIASKKKHALSSGPFGSNLTSAYYTNEGVIVLRGLNISDRRLNLDDVKFISEEKAQSLVRSEVRPGDIVVVAVGSSGLACQISNSLPRAIMSQNFNKISPDLNKTNPTYLEYCINSLFVQRQLKQEITDTVRTFLSLTKLKNVEIPLPPLRDQDNFDQIVQKSEQLRTKQRKTKRKSDDVFNSLVQRAFRGELKSTEAELVNKRENRNAKWGRSKVIV